MIPLTEMKMLSHRNIKYVTNMTKFKEAHRSLWREEVTGINNIVHLGYVRKWSEKMLVKNPNICSTLRKWIISTPVIIIDKKITVC